jgi:hypothetical protein
MYLSFRRLRNTGFIDYFETTLLEMNNFGPPGFQSAAGANPISRNHCRCWCGSGAKTHSDLGVDLIGRGPPARLQCSMPRERERCLGKRSLRCRCAPRREGEFEAGAQPAPPRAARALIWLWRARREKRRRAMYARIVQLLKEPFWDDDTSPLIRTMTQFCSKG